jgi:hypothetical protein
LAASQEPAKPYVATKFKFFRRRSEQLIGQEARGELKEASMHVLGAEASLEATLTVTKHQSSCLFVACYPWSISAAQE